MSPKGGGPRHPMRLTILVKLLLAFVVPTSLLFGLFAVVVHELARRELEAELGTRLTNIASSASTQIRGKYLVDLQAGDEQENLRYAGARRKLAEVREATGMARIYIFDRGFTSRVDTANGVAIGTKYFRAELDRLELARVFDTGAAVSSVLFQGVDGKLYKAGYAPIYASDDDREIVLAVGVDAPAVFFDRLAALRRNLLVYGAVLAVAVIGIAVLVATRITRPVRKLVVAAERIGKGDLAEPVARSSRDEIGFLAETMDEMRCDLRARDERLQMMLSGIAHEVRNPLGGIELFAGILRDEIPEDDERRSHVARIEREVGHLKAVVGDFLDYARRPAPEMSRIALDEVARDVVEVLGSDAEAAGTALRADTEETRCEGDRDQLRRVLLNLVRNAIQAASADGGGEIVVWARPVDGAAVVKVSNSGQPISEEVRKRLFEPFFTTREKGTGLGLAFVREIVEDHGGSIEIESSAETGTTFTITLQTA